MEPRELRIGNLILDDLGTVSYVARLGQSTIEVTRVGIYWLTCYRPEGIPLTEEWLIKFSFSGIEYWNKKDFLYRINMRGPKFYMMINENDIAESIELRYVHQLQNLYFALTGSELTIKETV